MRNLIFTLKDNIWNKILNDYSVKFYNLLTVLLLGSKALLDDFIEKDNFVIVVNMVIEKLKSGDIQKEKD